MVEARPRQLLILAGCLDLLGLSVGLVLLVLVRGLPLQGEGAAIATTICVYLLLGWLFGTYTLLRWRQLPFSTLCQRLALNAFGTLVVIAILRWSVNHDAALWVFQRLNQLLWIGFSAFWSLLIRLALRRGLLQGDPPAIVCLISDPEARQVEREWALTPTRHTPMRINVDQLLQVGLPLVLAVSAEARLRPDVARVLRVLEEHDPRDCLITTPLGLAERELERLPAALINTTWFGYGELPATQMFSPSRQLKRVADLIVALGLLVLSCPVLLLCAALIHLEDGGPVFYVQRRSGWLGRSFQLYKLRTMRVARPGERPSWTEPGDLRITHVGLWLRRARLDELPQLINVLRGDMSLIGPRPERPELEALLEEQIPHYRKRHWMRPGLSGWAQVSAPYAASVEDSELKLSYDLYYLKHFSTWMDVVILLRTIKTVLKLAGR